MKIDIFIPTIRSEEKIAPCLSSLNSTLIPDGIEVVVHVIREGNSYAEAINGKFKETNGEWFFCGADDLRFDSRWLIEALNCAEKTGMSVIGTNDLHHPAVVSGQYATHFLVKREYIEKSGGTFTDEKTVYYPYKHNFTDTELIAKAKVFKQFSPCLESVVEHMHPIWGKGVMDEGYRKSENTMSDDQAIFNQRLKDFSLNFSKHE